jgi:hypothetical protein
MPLQRTFSPVLTLLNDSHMVLLQRPGRFLMHAVCPFVALCCSPWDLLSGCSSWCFHWGEGPVADWLLCQHQLHWKIVATCSMRPTRWAWSPCGHQDTCASAVCHPAWSTFAILINLSYTWCGCIPCVLAIVVLAPAAGRSVARIRQLSAAGIWCASRALVTVDFPGEPCR